MVPCSGTSAQAPKRTSGNCTLQRHQRPSSKARTATHLAGASCSGTSKQAPKRRSGSAALQRTAASAQALSGRPHIWQRHPPRPQHPSSKAHKAAHLALQHPSSKRTWPHLAAPPCGASTTAPNSSRYLTKKCTRHPAAAPAPRRQTDRPGVHAGTQCGRQFIMDFRYTVK